MRLIRPFLILLVCLTVSAQTRPTNVKALVGGTLIDGYGSAPIRNSVVIIEGDVQRYIDPLQDIVIKHGRRWK